MADQSQYRWGTGRRKTAVARVRISPGSGKITINRREVDAYFPELQQRNAVRAPLQATDTLNKVDLLINVSGGGISGQAGAVILGVARAIKELFPEHDSKLRDGGYLTRDSRMIERKKYGHKKARKSFQFSKR